DTAGLRRKPRVEGKLEQLSVGDALRSIRFAEAVILVIDALQGLERQDLTIARLVEDEGRALVLALNKWDAVQEPAALAKHLRERPLSPCSPQNRASYRSPTGATWSMHCAGTSICPARRSG